MDPDAELGADRGVRYVAVDNDTPDYAQALARPHEVLFADHATHCSESGKRDRRGGQVVTLSAARCIHLNLSI